MVMAAFPVAKLGTLLLKQVSKPIASFAKEKAKSHPFFRKYVCMPPAQFYNWCEVKVKMWLLNLGKPVEVPKLNEAMAIELGANLLGETIVFTIAAGILFAEYARSSRKEAAKEQARHQEVIDLQTAIRELYFEKEKQNTQINEMLREIHDLETKISKARPFSSVKPPPSSPSPAENNESPNAGAASQIRSSVDLDFNQQGLINGALDYVTYVLPNKLFEQK